MNMWSLWCLLVTTCIVVSNANMIGSGSIVCPANDDCVTSCSPTTRNCYNKQIVCPTSTNVTTYNCTILCRGSFSCVGTTIRSTRSVSILEVQALDSSACENVDIQAEGTENIVLMCAGADACTHTNLTSNAGASMTLIATDGRTYGNTGFYFGMLNISQTLNVTLVCDSWGCSENHWFFNNIQNFNLKCTNNTACDSNIIQIVESNNVTIEASSEYPDNMMTANEITITKVKDLAVNFNGNGWGQFSLLDIERFLYYANEYTNPHFSWFAQNISNVAINSWDATSFWLVDGRPLQTEYKCPQGLDCNIRVDANLTARNPFSLPVICQTDLPLNNKTKPTATTCQFYCGSAYSSCLAINLTVKDVTNAALYLGANLADQVQFLSVNASASGLSNIKTTLNISCFAQGCIWNTFNVSNYGYVNIINLDSWGFANAVVNVSNFSQVTVLSSVEGLKNTTLILTDGKFVDFVPFLQGSNAFLGINSQFRNIERVAINCMGTLNCYQSRFDAVNVSDVSLICGTPDVFLSSLNCYNMIVNLQESSLNMTCDAVQNGCMDSIIRYNASNPDETSFTLNCEESQLYSYIPNCNNISIEVLDSERGFDAISFDCDVDNGNVACVDVTVSCGAGGVECHCPVAYDTNDEKWYCDGACGTSICGAEDSSSSSSSKETKYIIIGAAAVAALLLIVIITILVKKYRKKQAFQPLLEDGSKNNYN